MYFWRCTSTTLLYEQHLHLEFTVILQCYYTYVRTSTPQLYTSFWFILYFLHEDQSNTIVNIHSSTNCHVVLQILSCLINFGLHLVLLGGEKMASSVNNLALGNKKGSELCHEITSTFTYHPNASNPFFQFLKTYFWLCYCFRCAGAS